MKWHASTALASLQDQAARDEATAIIGALDAIEAATRASSQTSETLTADEQRVFYTAIGHLPDSYRQPQVARLLENAVGWALERGGCRP